MSPFGTVIPSLWLFPTFVDFLFWLSGRPHVGKVSCDCQEVQYKHFAGTVGHCLSSVQPYPHPTKSRTSIWVCRNSGNPTTLLMGSLATGQKSKNVCDFISAGSGKCSYWTNRNKIPAIDVHDSVVHDKTTHPLKLSFILTQFCIPEKVYYVLDNVSVFEIRIFLLLILNSWNSIKCMCDRERK